VSQVGTDAPELLRDAGLVRAQRLEEPPQAVVTSDIAATARNAEPGIRSEKWHACSAIERHERVRSRMLFATSIYSSWHSMRHVLQWKVQCQLRWKLPPCCS